MAHNRNRPLLPASSGPGPPHPSSSSLGSEGGSVVGSSIQLPSKSTKILSACLSCRKGKAKCSGARPRCGRCATHGFDCEYDAEPNTTSALALKKKYQESNAELTEYRVLVDFIRLRPENDAREILRRLRLTPDPLSVLSYVRDADLLLQRWTSGGLGDRPAGTIDSPRARDLDTDAYLASPIKVSARPWTLVAGNGIVSDLISSFFVWDYTFSISFIDRNCFLGDMLGQSPEEAKYCSPLLVNAICSLRSHTSSRAKAFGSVVHKDMRVQFLNAAKDLLDQEQGRPSLCTVQALLIMVLCTAGMGRDRAGRIYWNQAFYMLSQLRLEQLTVMSLQGRAGEADARPLKMASRALWGMYCFESICAFAYLQPSRMGQPALPRVFSDGPSPGTLDTQVAPVGDEQLAPVMLDATCDLSIILNDVMEYNATIASGHGTPKDLKHRSVYMSQARRWRETTRPELQVEHHSSPAIYLLSGYFDQVVLAIFRPLDPMRYLDDESCTAGEMCIAACRRTVEGLERWESQCVPDAGSVMMVYVLNNSSLTLAILLHEPSQTHDLFTRTCGLLSRLAASFPLATLLLRALRADADRRKVAIPPAAEPYFSEFVPNKPELRDVPLSFVLPTLEAAGSTGVGGSESGVEPIRVELGTLIERWNSPVQD